MRLLIGGSPSKIFHLKEFEKATDTSIVFMSEFGVCVYDIYESIGWCVSGGGGVVVWGV